MGFMMYLASLYGNSVDFVLFCAVLKKVWSNGWLTKGQHFCCCCMHFLCMYKYTSCIYNVHKLLLFLIWGCYEEWKKYVAGTGAKKTGWLLTVWHSTILYGVFLCCQTYRLLHLTYMYIRTCTATFTGWTVLSTPPAATAFSTQRGVCRLHLTSTHLSVVIVPLPNKNPRSSQIQKSSLLRYMYFLSCIMLLAGHTWMLSLASGSGGWLVDLAGWEFWPCASG